MAVITVRSDSLIFPSPIRRKWGVSPITSVRRVYFRDRGFSIQLSRMAVESTPSP